MKNEFENEFVTNEFDESETESSFGTDLAKAVVSTVVLNVAAVATSLAVLYGIEWYINRRSANREEQREYVISFDSTHPKTEDEN